MTYIFCSRIIGDFLLPASNFLPHLYRKLCATMKHIRMEYQEIDACPKDHIIYQKEHEYTKKCP